MVCFYREKGANQQVEKGERITRKWDEGQILNCLRPFDI